MSPDRTPGPRPGGSAGPLDTEQLVTRALDAHVAGIEPDPAAWARIEDRLDRGRGRVRRFGGSGRFGSTQRPVLVAAVFVLFLVVATSVIVRNRTGDGDLEVATAPASAAGPAIVALTDDGRIIELGLDGAERRQIYAPAADDTERYLTGPLAVSTDGTIYVERRSLTLVDCGESVAVRPAAGQIVAVPFAGGTPEVVVPVGGAPDVQPGSRRLTYTVPADGDACPDPDDGWAVGVTDLDTGATGRIAPTGIDLLAVEAASGDLDAAMQYDGLPAAMVAEVRWAGTGDALWLMVGYGPGLSSRAIMHLDLAIGPDTITADTMQLVVPGGPVPTDGGSASDRLFGATAFAVDHGEGDQGPGRDRIVFARGTRTVDVVDATLELDGLAQVGSGLDLTIEPGVVGAELLWASDIDIAPAGGQVLVVVGGTVVGPSSVPGSGPVSPSAESESTVTSLILLDGSRHRVLAGGVTAAAWVWTGAPRPGDPSGTVPPIESATSTSSTTEAPDPTSPRDPAGSLDIPPDPDPVAGSARADDARAIGEAFVDFFEHGDRSALEGSGVLEPALEEGAKTVPDGGQGVTVTIDRITFAGDTSAVVDFRLDQDGNAFTAPTTGSAVHVDGRWKVSAATMCTLLSRVQIPCPTSE